MNIGPGSMVSGGAMLYVADSESGQSNTTTHPGIVDPATGRNITPWLRGVRIGSLKDGIVKSFIPDPEPDHTGTSSGEGVAVDAKGNVYSAEVGQMSVKKYVKK